MVQLAHIPDLHRELFEHVFRRTGRRVRGLAIELCPEKVVLKGRSPSYHVKQLAQQGVLELLPHVELHNAIVVEPGPRAK
jgi:hypothetical protein